MLGIKSMDVRRIVIAEVHVDRDSIELAESGHETRHENGRATVNAERTSISTVTSRLASPLADVVLRDSQASQFSLSDSKPRPRSRLRFEGQGCGTPFDPVGAGSTSAWVVRQTDSNGLQKVPPKGGELGGGRLQRRAIKR